MWRSSNWRRHPGSRNPGAWHAKIKHRCRHMFHRVDASRDIQNLLCGRYLAIIDKRRLEDIESSPYFGAGKHRQSGAACAAMEVYAQLRREVSNSSGRRLKYQRDGRIPAIHVRESVLHNYCDFEIRPRVMQKFNCGRAKNAIAERSQPNDCDTAFQGQFFDNIRLSRHALFINYGFVDQHDGNFVADRVEAMAGNAAQAAAIGLEFNFGPARRTNENFEQIGTDGHVSTSLSAGLCKAAGVDDRPQMRSFADQFVAHAGFHAKLAAPRRHFHQFRLVGNRSVFRCRGSVPDVDVYSDGGHTFGEHLRHEVATRPFHEQDHPRSRQNACAARSQKRNDILFRDNMGFHTRGPEFDFRHRHL